MASPHPRLDRRALDRWAGLEGWWIMAGLLALLLLAFLKAVLVA